MNDFGFYIRELEFRIMVDDTRKGEIYILDYYTREILFVVDITDRCLYINQDILNKFTEVDIKNFLNNTGMDFDIFPYFNEAGDVGKLKPSAMEFFQLIMKAVTRIDFRFSKFILLTSFDGYLMDYDRTIGRIYVSNSRVFNKISDEYYPDKMNNINKTLIDHFGEDNINDTFRTFYEYRR